MNSEQLIAGVMSGTSLDGIDVALVHFKGSSLEDFSWNLMAFEVIPYETYRQTLLFEVMQEGTPEGFCRINKDLGEWMSEAVFKVCESAGLSPRDLTAIGCHGHTMWHIPPESGMRGSTLQLGDPATVAELTGVTVVSDFRSRDVAAGGHGAPLVAWPDQLLYSAPNKNRVLHNIGGMSNVTWLPQSGSTEPPVAFDTGPGMVLIDEVARRATNNELPFDVGGEMAQRGRIDEGLLTILLDDDYLRLEPPKTTGRERYGRTYVDRLTDNIVPNSKDLAWHDLIATLTAFTAQSIGIAYRMWVVPLGVDEIFLMGGGSKNRVLTDTLRKELAPIPVNDGGELGVDPDAREALAFAVLTWAHLHGLPANVPYATGACGSRILGSLTPGVSS